MLNSRAGGRRKIRAEERTLAVVDRLKQQSQSKRKRPTTMEEVEVVEESWFGSFGYVPHEPLNSEVTSRPRPDR